MPHLTFVFIQMNPLYPPSHHPTPSPSQALIGESYNRSYRLIVQAQQLAELEEVIMYQQCSRGGVAGPASFRGSLFVFRVDYFFRVCLPASTIVSKHVVSRLIARVSMNILFTPHEFFFFLSFF
jgi:hypothetical protein